MAKGTMRHRYVGRNTSLSTKLAFYGSPEEDDNGCILWLGAQGRGGYGICGWRKKVWSVHRLAWINAHGEIPNGMHVLHTCDVRHCINPAHLWLGTNADNIADKVRKGRASAATGTKNGNAKLTEADARAIRTDARPLREIAAEYGVSETIVSGIRRGTKWRHA